MSTEPYMQSLAMDIALRKINKKKKYFPTNKKPDPELIHVK